MTINGISPLPYSQAIQSHNKRRHSRPKRLPGQSPQSQHKNTLQASIRTILAIRSAIVQRHRSIPQGTKKRSRRFDSATPYFITAIAAFFRVSLSFFPILSVNVNQLYTVGLSPPSLCKPNVKLCNASFCAASHLAILITLCNSYYFIGFPPPPLSYASFYAL